MKLGFLICVLLMSSVYNASAEKSIPIKEEVDLTGKTEKKGFFSKLIEKVNIFSDKTEEVTDAQTEKAKKINPAERFPDPFFYDAVYQKKENTTVPIWLYNDKTNYENNHIPMLFHYKYIIDDIFSIMRDPERTAEIILLIDTLAKRNDVNLNKQDKFGNTLLHYAIRYNNKAIFHQLLETNGVNPNVCNYSYICPIHLAVYKQDSDEISQLVNYGVDLKYSNDRFEMPIIIAIRLHYYTAIYTLARKHKERGTSINEIDYIIFSTKQAGLPDLTIELYEFFMLDRELGE